MIKLLINEEGRMVNCNVKLDNYKTMIEDDIFKISGGRE